MMRWVARVPAGAPHRRSVPPGRTAIAVPPPPRGRLSRPSPGLPVRQFAPAPAAIPQGQNRSPRVVRPPSRCAITMTGCSSSVTVHMPSSPWKITTASRTWGRRAGWFGIPPVGPGQTGQDQAEQAQSRGQVAVDHFPPRLAHVQRPLRECLGGIPGALRNDELPVAARPVGAAQPGVGQAHPCADDHDQQGQHRPGAGQRQKDCSHCLTVIRLMTHALAAILYRPGEANWACAPRFGFSGARDSPR